VGQKVKTIAVKQMRRITGNGKGFTLLEVLLAFFIFSILFITIYTSYSGSFKTITMTEARMELYRKAAITLERISEDIQASYISVPPPEGLGTPAEYTKFFGENDDINGSEADTLHFFTRIPPLFDDEMEIATGRVISYDVEQRSGEDELLLLRSENPEFIDEPEEIAAVLLCDGLQAINFTYFDADGVAHDSWDSDSEEYDGYLPRMVTIALEFRNLENPEHPFKFTTSVSLPLDSSQSPE
jgi:prepilin-type N-terminal cleavage/methylation domain-containing protein